MLDELLPDEIFALTLYGEARGEPIDGIIAVANVIMNRLNDNPAKYKNVRNVCLEPKQFSCWNDDDPNKAKLLAIADQFVRNDISDKSLKQCWYIAKGVMTKNLLDNTKSAKNYMTESLFNGPNKPNWAKNPKTTPTQIGNHVFFNV